MGLEQAHPLYIENVAVWKKNRDVYKGTETVKECTIEYLKPTQGMVLDGMDTGDMGSIGGKAYKAYLERAVFPEAYRDGVDMLIGVMHKKPPNITLPPQLEFLRENATIQGENLELLLRRINTEQLCPGRLGLLLDFKSGNDGVVKPYLSLYLAESIINWDESNDHNGHDDLQMVVLDESGYVRSNYFEWKNRTQYRVVVNTKSELSDSDDADLGTVKYGVFASDGGVPSFDESVLMPVEVMGSPVTQVPFVFINSRDLLATPDTPPLNGLANLSLTIYRGEADYRQTLFLQSQETLVIVGAVRNEDGEDDAIRVGTGSRIEVDIGGDAKYIGVSGSGLSEQRTALENDYKRASEMSGKMLSDSSDGESGEALKIRVSAQTANLVQVALTGARGLEQILKIACRFIGADESLVAIEPNLEFSSASFQATDLAQYMSARNMGVPLSLESIHALLVDKGVTKLDFRTEKKLYDKEMQDGLTIVPGIGSGEEE